MEPFLSSNYKSALKYNFEPSKCAHFLFKSWYASSPRQANHYRSQKFVEATKFSN